MKSYMNFMYTIKIHNHRFNDKNVEKVFVRDYTKYVQKCPRQRLQMRNKNFKNFEGKMG